MLLSLSVLVPFVSRIANMFEMGRSDVRCERKRKQTNEKTDVVLERVIGAKFHPFCTVVSQENESSIFGLFSVLPYILHSFKQCHYSNCLSNSSSEKIM